MNLSIMLSKSVCYHNNPFISCVGCTFSKYSRYVSDYLRHLQGEMTWSCYKYTLERLSETTITPSPSSVMKNILSTPNITPFISVRYYLLPLWSRVLQYIFFRNIHLIWQEVTYHMVIHYSLYSAIIFYWNNSTWGYLGFNLFPLSSTLSFLGKIITSTLFSCNYYELIIKELVYLFLRYSNRL